MLPPQTPSEHPAPHKATCAFVGLGANLGSRQSTLNAAVNSLSALPHSKLLRCSSFYESTAVGCKGPLYLNAVALLQTQLKAHDLLCELQIIEQNHGRKRPFPNAPRTLDLDLLLYGDECIQTATLQVPHPRLHERAFVLRPLAELAPHWVVPRHGPVSELLLTVAHQHTRRQDNEREDIDRQDSQK
jgi:2-amino-4-hydroxy-6-hydroxymethyldihydropteridine diphosphokinase